MVGLLAVAVLPGIAAVAAIAAVRSEAVAHGASFLIEQDLGVVRRVCERSGHARTPEEEALMKLGPSLSSRFSPTR